MAVTRIIIIIGQAAAAGSSAVLFLLACAAGFLFIFATDGDHVVGAINTTQTRSICLPPSQLLANQLIVTVKNGQIDEKKLAAWGAIWLDEGIDVRILEHSGGLKQYRAPRGEKKSYMSDPSIIRVALLDDSKRTCWIGKHNLEMNFIEWVKWKWDKYSAPAVAAPPKPLNPEFYLDLGPGELSNYISVGCNEKIRFWDRDNIAAENTFKTYFCRPGGQNCQEFKPGQPAKGAQWQFEVTQPQKVTRIAYSIIRVGDENCR